VRIVVTGLVASFPLGGVAWDYLAYVDGFRRLGCDVFYLEDTGQWLYDPARETFTDDANGNIRWLVDALRMVDMPAERFAVRVPDGTFHGAGREAVTSFCRSADLFLNISGSCWLRDEYRGAKCTAYLDSDPGYTQEIRHYDRFFTFAENIGQPDCAVPDGGLSWIPTRQPVVLERWPFSFDADASRFTTVMSWKTDVRLPMIDGVRHGGKNVEFSRFVELPRRTRIPMEVAISGAAPFDHLRALGWHLVSARDKSATMDAYRAYLAQSRGEWSVSKNVYVVLRSGWFSCRSAVYLALGKPVVVQDTGWSKYYPTGAGLFAFDTPDEAVAALEAANGDYRRQCEAARAVAESAFAADKVLERLLADCDLT
jgi:hypothetical protein